MLSRIATLRALGSILVLMLVGSGSVTAQPSRLVFGTADTAPYSTPEQNGFYDRILLRAGEILGIDISINRYPSKRSVLETTSGRVDGEFARTRVAAESFADLQLVPAPLTDFQFVAIGRPGIRLPESFDELWEFHVGYISGWRIYEEQVTRTQSVTTVDDETQLFGLLLTERVDVILYSRYRAMAWIARQNEATARAVAIADQALSVQPMYLLLHDRHASLIPAFAEAIEQVRSEPDYDRWHVESFGFPPAR